MDARVRGETLRMRHRTRPRSDILQNVVVRKRSLDAVRKPAVRSRTCPTRLRPAFGRRNLLRTEVGIWRVILPNRASYGTSVGREAPFRGAKWPASTRALLRPTHSHQRGLVSPIAFSWAVSGGKSPISVILDKKKLFEPRSHQR